MKRRVGRNPPFQQQHHKHSSGRVELPLGNTDAKMINNTERKGGKQNNRNGGVMFFFFGHRYQRLMVWFGAVLVFILVLLMLHEFIYWILLQRLDISNYMSRHRRENSDNMQQEQNLRNRNDHTSSSSVAVISLHEGYKFVGYLGHWLRENKKIYATMHNYVFLDKLPSPAQQQEHQLFPLKDWQLTKQKVTQFNKLRLILHTMESNPHLKYILWLDGDTVVANPAISIHQRLDDIQQQQQQIITRDGFENNNTNNKNTTNFCMIWSEDMVGPNSGVFILSNTRTGKQLVRDALLADVSKERFRDQAALTLITKTNSTYQDCTILVGKKDATLLQSRVRGQSMFLYKKNDWVLHLPNHNRIELLQSITKWLPTSISTTTTPLQS